MQFMLWVLDIFFIPFALVVILTGYRLPRMMRLAAVTKTDYQARSRCLREFCHVLVDVLVFAVALVPLFSWRMPLVVSRFRLLFNKAGEASPGLFSFALCQTACVAAPRAVWNWDLVGGLIFTIFRGPRFAPRPFF